MIALLASLVLLFYVWLPGATYLFVYSWFVPGEAFQRTKMEEVTFASSACLVPAILTVLLFQVLKLLGHSPLLGSDIGASYKTFLAAAYSEHHFSHGHLTFWHAAAQVLRTQVWVLGFLYAFVCAKAAVYGYLTQNLWWVLDKGAVSKWVADHFLVPNVSEWYFLLAAPMFPPNSRRVEIDVLTADNHLYRGTVSRGGYFLNKDGNLAGIMLKDVSRYDRWQRTKDREEAVVRGTDQYWKKIPGANWYIPDAKILNLNIRYELDDKDLLDKELRRLKIQARVTLAPSPPASSKQSNS